MLYCARGIASRVRRAALAACPLAGLFVAACAGPGPKLFPPAPLKTEKLADGGEQRYYAVNHRDAIDYGQRLSPDGRVVLLRFDANCDGTFEEEVSRALASGPAVEGDRHLVILADSVPIVVVKELWAAGRFRLFYPPSRLVAPFPVMTDLSFSEFFGTSPSPGEEAEYFDGRQLVEGYGSYAHERNAGWLARTDYYLPLVAHAAAYLSPWRWYDHELGKIQRHFYRSKKRLFIGYIVTTSALGATIGRTGHEAALIRLDRFCETVMHRLRGRVQITLLSDHGHNLMPSKRIPLRDTLKKFGYRVGSHLRRPYDVVVPEFGVVNCAAVYTRLPAAVARDVVGIEGVGLAMFVEGDEVVVQSRTGRARVGERDGRLRYRAERGDPLELLATLKSLAERGEADSDGYISGAALFEATKLHKYPDALHRIWRAFHGLMVHTPDVLISIEDGWHSGSKLMTDLVDVSAAHGSLNDLSTFGFVMSTAARLPDPIRMESLAGALRNAGVPLGDRAVVDSGFAQE